VVTVNGGSKSCVCFGIWRWQQTGYGGGTYADFERHSRKSLKLIAHALQNNIARSACLATNQHALPVPRMPTVHYFSRSGFMGVSYVGCTIGDGRT